IRLGRNGDPDTASVYDRGHGAGLTRYFQAFLDGSRRFSSTELTQRLQKATLEVAEKLKDSLPHDVRKRVFSRIRAATTALPHFDPESPLPYLSQVFAGAPDLEA